MVSLISVIDILEVFFMVQVEEKRKMSETIIKDFTSFGKKSLNFLTKTIFSSILTRKKHLQGLNCYNKYSKPTLKVKILFKRLLQYQSLISSIINRSIRLIGQQSN